MVDITIVNRAFVMVYKPTYNCNELVNRAYFMVYKATNITGGPHPLPGPATVGCWETPTLRGSPRSAEFLPPSEGPTPGGEY